MGIADKRAMIRETQAIFDDIGIDIDPQAVMRSLCVAQCQLVESLRRFLLGTYYHYGQLTPAITESEVETLFTQIRRRRRRMCHSLYFS